MPTLVPHNDPYDKEKPAAKSPEELSSAENQPAGREGAFARERDKLENLQRLAGDMQDILGKGFTAIPAGKLGAAQKIAQSLWGTKKRKNGTIAGGISGLLLTAFMVSSTFVSGPLEFVHLSQLLTESLMSQNEETSDNWMSKAFRRARGAQLQELRVGRVTAKWLGHVDKKLIAAGFTPTYTDNFRFGTGYSVDIAKAYALDPTSPMDLEVARAKLASEFGVDLNRNPDLITVSDGKVQIAAAAGEASHRTVNKFNRKLMTKVGYNRLTGGMTAWATSKRAGSVSALHPIKKIDQAILKNVDLRISKWREDRAKTIQGGDATTRTPQPNDRSSTTDANGNTVTPDDTGDKMSGVQEVNAVVADADVNKPGALTSLVNSPTFRATGITSATIGLICLANSMANSYDAMYFQEIVTPLKNIYQEWVSLGEQIKAGVAIAQTDLSWEQIGDYILLMRKKVEANGEDSTADTDTAATQRLLESVQQEEEDDLWNQPAIRQANHTPEIAGTEVPVELTNVGEKNIILEIFGNNTIKNVCEPVNSWAGQLVMTGIDIVSGPISGVISTAGSMIFGPKLITWVMGSMLGKMVDEQNAGIAMGYYAWHGGEYLSNEMLLAKGARQLEPEEKAAWNVQIAQINQERFQEKSFAKRMLDPMERRSLAGRAIHNIDPSIKTNLSNFASGFMNISKSFSALGSSLMGVKSASAAGLVTYQSGIPAYGFSLDELSDESLDIFNPDNSATVVETVNTSLANTAAGTKSPIRTLLEECSGTKINLDTEGSWAAWPASYIETGGVNPYSSSYRELGCVDGGTTTDPQTWALMRSWLGASITMEQALCNETGEANEDQSCSYVGFAGDPSGPATSTAGGAAGEAAAAAVAAGGFTWPSPGYRITSAYNAVRTFNGKTSVHRGMDIDQGDSSAAVALHDGTITQIYPTAGSCPYTMTGSCVQLSWTDATTGQRYDAYYNHQEALVSVGQQVTAGTPISRYNGTGLTTGSHLHLEMYVDGTTINPTTLIGGGP